MKRFWSFMALVISLILLLGLTSSKFVNADPDAPEAPANNPNWQTAVKLSQTNTTFTGGILPSIASSDSGSKIITVFSNIRGGNNGDHDIFFVRSTNFGANWSAQTQVHSSPGITSDSNFSDVTITPNNKGHAVWIEEVGDVPRLVYKNEDNWGNNSTNLVTISAPSNPIVMAEPRIVAKTNTRLDVIWSQGVLPDNPNIYHAYSINGGASWQGVAPIANTPPSSRLPDIAIDSSGNYHVVWEEGTNPTTIHYLRGVPNVNAVNWTQTAEISISQRSITTGAATQPKIIVVGNVLHVIYTNFITDDQQFVHYLRCNGNCNNPANWTSVSNPISGQVLGANASDPFDLIPAVTQHGQCIYTYFHGVQGAATNEQIWGVNSCSNWAASARDQVTLNTIRAINPSITSGNDWWLYLTYEQVNADSSLREVFFVRNRPALYLPTILR